MAKLGKASLSKMKSASKARQKKNMKVRQTTHATANCVIGVVGPLNQSYSGGSDGDGGGYILDVVVKPRWRRGAHPWPRMRRGRWTDVGSEVRKKKMSVNSFTTHQHANSHTKQKLHTSHTSHPLHSHAHDVRCIPRSQTRIRVATPRVNPSTPGLIPCNHLAVPRQTGVWTVADTQTQHIHTNTSPAAT
jgi:hypothetical protein